MGKVLRLEETVAKEEEKILKLFLKEHEEGILANWLEKVHQLSLNIPESDKINQDSGKEIFSACSPEDPCKEILTVCYPDIVRYILAGKDKKVRSWIETANQRRYAAGTLLKCVLQGHSILREVVVDKLWEQRKAKGWDLQQINRFRRMSHRLIDTQMQKISDCYLEVYHDELLDKERKHFQLTERMPDVIYSYSPKKGLSFVSQAAGRLLGTTPQEFYQHGFPLWVDHVHPADREDFLASFKQQLETDEELEYEYRLVHKNGDDILHVINRSIPIINSDGEVISVDGIVIDITERKKMEQEIRARNRQLEKLMAELQKTNQQLLNLDQRKSELVKIVAHDLRNPLNSIRLFTELLITYKDSPEEYEDFLHRIDEETTRLMNMIDNFLDIEKIEAGALRYKKEKIDLADLVEHFLFVFKWEMDKKGVSFSTENLETINSVWGDHARLSQVFSNLLGNAVKFTPRGGQIHVRAKLVAGTRKADRSKRVVSSLSEEEKSLVKISIWNNGPSIPQEYHKKVFAQFFQIESSSTGSKRNSSRQNKGSGLGLAIAKEVVEHHGGRIWVESKQDKGVTFFFTLPYGENNYSI